MSDNNQKPQTGCTSCGSSLVMLTEDKNAAPRCGGCGKPVQSKK